MRALGASPRPAGCRAGCTPSPGGSGRWAGHRGQRDHQPGAAGCLVLAVLGVVVGQPAQRRPVGSGLQVLPVPGAVVVAIRVVFRSVFGGDIDASDHARALHPAAHPPALLGGRRAARWAGHPGGDPRRALRRPAARRACCAASARPTAWPIPSGPCGSCPARSTSSAWPWWWLAQRGPPAGRERAAGAPGPPAARRGHRPGSTPCGPSPSPC